MKSGERSLDKGLTKWLIVALTVSCAVLIVLLVQRDQIEQRVALLTVPLSQGTTVSLPDKMESINGAMIRNQGTILFAFFNPDCPSCQHEVPVWNWLNHKYSDRITIIGVSKAEPIVLKQFEHMYEVQYDLISDRTAKLFDEFRVRSVPFDVLVDNGIVAIDPHSQSTSIQLKRIEEYVSLSTRETRN